MREQFFTALRNALIANWGHDWASDTAKLDRFMEAARAGRANINSKSFVTAWHAIGMKGKPTYKGIDALK